MRGYIYTGLLILFLVACGSEEPEVTPSECESLAVSYSETVEPLISSACGITGCHVSGFEWGDFTSYAGVKEQAESGRLWLLVGVVRTMPPQNSLFEEDLEMLKCWLDEGARDN